MRTLGVVLDGRTLIEGEPFGPDTLGTVRALAKPYMGRLGVDPMRLVGVRVTGERIEFTSVAPAGQPAHVTGHGERFQVRRYPRPATTS